MTVIALDQSTKLTGYSVWNDDELIEHGVLNSKIKENNFIKRIKVMSKLIEQLIDKYNPKYLAIEDVQFQKNYSVYHQLSCNQGSIMKILFDRNILFSIIPANTWRSYNDIKGNKKREEQKMAAIALVKDLYNVEATDDECEAILMGRYLTEKLIKNDKRENNYD